MLQKLPLPFSLTPAPLSSVSPRGWFLRELIAQKNGLTGHIDAIWEDLGPTSGWLGGSGENWERGPYYLDGLVPLAYLLRDDALQQKAQPWIEWMLASQREDGFFGPADNLDWWPRMVALKVLTQYAEATDDPCVIPFLDRYFRFQLQTLPAQPLSMWAAARGQEQLLPMLWLYRRTGEPYLLDLAQIIRKQSYDWGSFFPHFPYEKTTHAYLNRPLFMAAKRMTLMQDWTAKRVKKARVKRGKPSTPPKPKTAEEIERSNASPFLRAFHQTHGVNLAMALKMPALDALFGGDADGFAAVQAGFDAIERYHGLANGLFSGDEHLNGRSPTVGAELCLAAELLFSLETLLAATGDNRYAERIEEIAYNAWPATFTPDLCAHQYVQQVNQIEVSRKKRGWYDAYEEANLFGLAPNFGCCAANMHQGWPKLAGVLAMATPDGVALPVYAPCTATLDVRGTTVRFTEETNYPFAGEIVIRIDEIENESRALDFALRLRLPSWAETYSLFYNGTQTEIEKQNGYLILRKQFSAGDQIRLSFPLKLRLVPEAAGGASVHVGALLLALPIAAQRRVVRGTPPFADYEYMPRGEWRFGIGNYSLANAVITHIEPGELPFDTDHPPLTVRLPLAPAPQWKQQQNSAGPVPEPFSAAKRAFIPQMLIPYGCTQLRIAQFPIVNNQEE
ncbi:MAG: glycoside hydrolase family 127 protein [Eubacteriales bacterium]|nr:glycoside hydrolase family 127 protein [Eubacteriales bacterium]